MLRGPRGAQRDLAAGRALVRVGRKRVYRMRCGDYLHLLVGVCEKGVARVGAVWGRSNAIRGHLGDHPGAAVGSGARRGGGFIGSRTQRDGFPGSAALRGGGARLGNRRILRDSRCCAPRPAGASRGALGANGGRILHWDTPGGARGLLRALRSSVVRRGMHGRRSIRACRGPT